MSCSVRIAAVGSWSDPEFASLRQILPERCDYTPIDWREQVHELEQDLPGSQAPDLILFAQRWSDEYPPRTLASLRRTFPLSRWICCFGPWCLADGRTRDLFPYGSRVPVENFVIRFRQEWDRLRGLPASPFPITASRDETFIEDYGSSLRGNRPLRSTLIVSPDPAYSALLRDCARTWQWTTTDQNPEVLLFDGDPECPQIAAEFAAHQQRSPSARSVVLTGLWHAGIDGLWKHRGADLVLCKTMSLTGLYTQIQDLFSAATA